MILIFCISNLYVPATLTLIKKANGKPIIVYTDQNGILDFFNNLKIEGVDVFYRPEFYLKKDLATLYDYFKKRKSTLEKLEQLNPQELYFFHSTFGEIENWLIKKLSKRSIIYYIPLFSHSTFERKYNFRSIKEVSTSIIKGVRIEPLWNGNIFIPRTAQSFFTKIGSQEKQLKIDNLYIDTLIQKKFNFADKEIILLTGTVVELGQVEESHYIAVMNELIRFFHQDKLLVKPHPRLPNRYGLEKEIDLIPSFIPANVLLVKFRIFIGYSSTILAEAANEGKLSISLLDYFPPVSTEKRNGYKNYLENNLHQGRIFYPKNLNEIRNILIENKFFHPVV